MKQTLSTRTGERAATVPLHLIGSASTPAMAAPLAGENYTTIPCMREAALAGLSPTDRQLFQLFGQGPRVRPRFTAVHHGFEHFARIQPEALAIEHLGETITYGALDEQATRLAAHLQALGVNPGDAVGLYLQRSIPMVVGILAVLKLGAAYVPQHLGVAPENTLRHISQITKAPVVLGLARLGHDVPLNEAQTLVHVDGFMDGGGPVPKNFRPPHVSPDDRCFILFTSGTTGVPNGVQVTHGNVCNILQTAPGDLGIRPGMRVGQILSVAFDMAAWEILGCLSNGGTLVIRGRDFQAVAESVDVIVATPSILASVDADRCRNVKTVAVAGEPCPEPLADRWSRFANFYNSCGPTETTIINTAERHFPGKPSLTIGRPTPNNTVYVLDENLQPCPIGDVGEMWAGGDCVTAGYLGNDKLTRQRYRPDPFLGGGRMMFRTRDLGRWTPDGELEHFGRVDDQVKVRGFRVELDSVSAAMEKAPRCCRAATLQLDPRTLVGFVSPATVNIGEAKRQVADRLPYYCIPAFILALDTLPLTPRGKIDKRTLLAMAEEKRPESLEAAP